MNPDLKKIKKLYGEKMAHLCRSLFPTILEAPGLLVELMTNTFEPSHLIYDDVCRKSSDFQDYIIGLAIKKKVKDIETNLSVRELLNEAGYDFFECRTEEEIQSFRKYYQKGEEICTFRTNRLNSCYVFFAVKKNIDEIKRENFPKPMRQDEYGTSVISIQFARNSSNDLSIKNRYNHTVANPDATFSNNLENIIPGLTDAFKREYGFRLKRKPVRNLELLGYVNVDGKFYKYNYEIDNIYYCIDNVVIDNFEVKKYEKEKYIVMDYFILDLVNKKMSVNPNSPGASSDSFMDEFNDIDKINVINTEGGNKEVRIITKTNHEIIIGLDNCNRIISYHNPRVIEIKNNFLAHNETLGNLSLPNLKKVGNKFLRAGTEIKELSLPSLEETGDYFFKSCCLTRLDAPNLKKVGNNFLRGGYEIKELSLPSLEEVGDWFFINSKAKKLNLPNLKKAGRGFLEYSWNLKILSLPSLEEVGDCFLCYNQVLEEIDLPRLKKVGYDFLKHNNSLRKLFLPSLEETDNSFLEKNRYLKEAYMPRLKKVGYWFLSHNTSLRKMFLPLLEEVGDEFLSGNTYLQEFSAPNLKKVGYDFLKKAKNLKLLFVPSLKEGLNEFLERLNNKTDTIVQKNEGMYEVSIAKVEQSSVALCNTINEVIKNGAEFMQLSTETIELEGVTR